MSSFTARGNDSPAAVSYTHLDVYKRQDNKSVYVFVIPLINDLLFELYKVSPLPKY